MRSDSHKFYFKEKNKARQVKTLTNSIVLRKQIQSGNEKNLASINNLRYKLKLPSSAVVCHAEAKI